MFGKKQFKLSMFIKIYKLDFTRKKMFIKIKKLYGEVTYRKEFLRLKTEFLVTLLHC